ncbi:RRQRL motif-containing zinc-binding protein [Streptomyces sp. Edi4]|uniref:RRQRL motif-containing zinc-binding protein n=1 Tax=Streptomyces sp. Edi4 TaxID=3162527 RepID=UPI00330685D5
MRTHDITSKTTKDLVDVDVYAPKKVRPTIPIYKRNQAPEGLATLRQLKALGLRPGGQQVVAEVETRGPKNGFLYEIAKAKPRRIPTLAQEWALDRAMAARQTCPECKRRYFYCLRTSLGICLECHEGTPADPSSYTPPASLKAA